MEATVYLNKWLKESIHNIAMSVIAKSDNSVEAQKQGCGQFKKNWNWSVQYQFNSGIGAGIIIGRY